MHTLLRMFVLASALVALGAPEGRAATITLSLDPALSALTPEVGAPQALSGSIVLEIGSLPLGGSNTSFDVIGLSLTASGSATIGLDPGLASPGLGVLNAAGSFLVPTLFVRIDDGAVTDLAIPDVTGNVTFGSGGASIRALATAFEIQTPDGVVSVSLFAVPEPATAVFLSIGLAALGARRNRQESSR